MNVGVSGAYDAGLGAVIVPRLPSEVTNRGIVAMLPTRRASGWSSQTQYTCDMCCRA
jgi:hypothetical protein